jgi:ATP-dependent Clp endopeptidase proteolytic subunit ClpP
MPVFLTKNAGMAHSFKRIQAKSKSEVDVFIYGDIGYDWWEGVDNTANRFVRDFKELEGKYARINVHINSVGGTLYDGLPIYNTLKYSPRDVHTYIDGVAMSMAGIIALAGHTVHAYNSSLLHAHSPIGVSYGNARDFRRDADSLDKWQKALAAAMMERTGKDEATITKELFDYEDHFFTAEEAKAYGLVDVIEAQAATFPDGVEPAKVAEMDREQLQAAYRKAYAVNAKPDAFMRRAAALFGFKPNSLFTNSQNSTTEMDTKKVAASLGLPEAATEEQILAKIDEHKTAAEAAAGKGDAPTPAAAMPATAAATATVDAQELADLKAKAEKVDALETRIKAIEDAPAISGGGAHSAGDFSDKEVDAFRDSYKARGEKGIFDE